MLDTVLTALRGRDFAAAAHAARGLIVAEPDHAEAHHLLSLALRELGDLDGAQHALERALELAPEHAPYHVSRAMLATLRKDDGAARAALGEAVKQDPNQLMAYVSLAQLALSASDLVQAEQHLRYAERVNAEHPHVLVVRGQMLLARGDVRGGTHALSRAAEQAPDDAMVQGTLGLALLAQRHYAFAEQALRNALATQPQVRSLRFALLQSLLGQQRNAEAEQEADTLLAQGADDPQAWLLKGQLAAGRAAYEESAGHLLRSLELRPGHAQTLDALLGVWVAAGQNERAEKYVEDLVQRSPQYDAGWSALIEFHRREPRLAADTALRWQAARPDSLAANELAAQVLEAAGDLNRAAQCAARVATRAPGRVAAQLVLTRAELRDGQAAAARARIETLLQDGRDPALQKALAGWHGRCCDATGDARTAVAAWLQAQRLLGPEAVLPTFASPDAALEARTADALAASSAIDPQGAPLLLWGAPGSGVEQLAALLRTGTLVLADRFGPTPRDDGFRLDGLGTRSASTPEEAGQRFAQRWREALTGVGADAKDVDWLPHWDARLLPPLVRGLPGTRMIVALRDPRDMLLNWLAFGAAQRLPLHDPMRAAQWLVSALEQLGFLANRTQPALRVVWMDRLETAPEQTLNELAQFAGLPQPPSSEVLQRAGTGVGGLPSAFPAGHWKRYSEALREPFALLEPIAQRLGGA
jgi:predicted Zn-dependent protease